MRRLKYTLGRKALNQIYISYVRPLLEYSSLVWGGCTEQEAICLERLQNEAARIVTGLTRSVSLVNLYNECGWDSLSHRRNLQKYYFMYKVSNNLVPSYVIDLFPPLVNQRTNYTLRSHNNFTVPLCRTEIFKRSCIPSSINLWNDLDISKQCSKTLSAFKSSQVVNKEKVPSYYLHGKRQLAIIHARLRNKCSNLKNDLYNNFLIDTPYCNCNNDEQLEDSDHYFFVCQFYKQERITLFTETRCLHPLNTDTLLYGSKNLLLEQNVQIFDAVQKYIHITKRFNE